MAKTTKTNVENVKPDVAGALQVIRSKKSREQMKAERLRPFVHVIDAALSADWSWSAIVRLIREHGGPSLTKRDAEVLYAQLKDQCLPGDNGETGECMPVIVPLSASTTNAVDADSNVNNPKSVNS